jgi:hypothetical protein
MSTNANNSNYSVLDVMKRAHLAREAGVLTAAECREINRLANRLSFALDYRRPGMMTAAERARFDHLVQKIFPPLSHSGRRREGNHEGNSRRNSGARRPETLTI